MLNDTTYSRIAHHLRAIGGCCVLFSLAWLLGCGGDPVAVHLVIESENPDVLTVEMLSSVNGKSREPSHLDMTEPEEDSPILLLPAGSTGTLKLEASGYDSGGCLLVSGTKEVEIIPTGRDAIRVTLTLKNLKQPTCHLSIDVNGDGLVQIEIDGETQECEPESCERDIPMGHVVRLLAKPGAKSDLAYWSGGICSGPMPMCEFSMIDDAHVTVAFATKICSKDGWCQKRGIPSNQSLNAVTGTAWNDIWVGGEQGSIFHWDGASWSTEYVNKGLSLRSMFASSPSDVWAVGGSGSIFRYVQNHYWYAFYPRTSAGLYSVWAVSPKEVYAVGEQSTVLKFDGNVWNTLTVPGPGTEWLRGVTAPVTGQWWAAANSGRVIRWDGTSFDVSMQPLRAIFSAARDDIWVAGDRGAIFHLHPGSAGSFERVVSPTQENLNALWGKDPTDLWAAGENGTLLHYDGQTWKLSASPSGYALFGMWGSPSEEFWAVGANGTVLRHGNSDPAERRLPR